MRRLVCFAVVTLSWLPLSFSVAQEADIQALVGQLSDPDPATARSALDQLSQLGPEAKDAVPGLVEALKSTDPQVRGYAAVALERIGKPAESAAEALVQAAFDENAAVRRAAIKAILAIDPPREVTGPVVEKILLESDPSVIVPALATFAEQVQDDVPRLREFLKKPKVAYWGAVLAADLGPKAASAVPELTALLADPEHEVRLQAAIALGEIGPESAAAVPELVRLLESDEVQGVRFAAAFALGKIGKGGDEVNRPLVDAARADQPILKMLCLWALAKINPEETRVVRYAAETIVKNLASDDPQLRAGAARALADFEGHADVVAPALVAALKDADPSVVGSALDALASIGPKIVDRVANALQEPELRHYATRLLFRMGPEAAPAVPALVEALKQEAATPDDVAFRVEVQLALAAIGTEAAPAVPELVKSLASDDREIRGTACYALGKIGPDASAALAELEQRVQDLGIGEKLPLLWAMLKIRPGDATIADMAAPGLIQALDHEDPVVRAEAAAALGGLGDRARSAITRLQQLLQDRDAAVRSAAENALKGLGAENGAPSP